MLEEGEGKSGALDGGGGGGGGGEWRARVGRGVRRVEHWRGVREWVEHWTRGW